MAITRKISRSLDRQRQEEYEILIDPSKSESLDSLEGELRSSRLDPQLHPNGRIKLSIETKGKLRDASESAIRLDAFQLRSIDRYVGSQGSIRKQLAAALLEDRRKGNAKPLKSRLELWSEVRLTSLYIRNKMVFEAGRTLPGPGISPRRLARFGDRKTTRDRFMIEMTADWAHEHVFFASFRDGVLIVCQAEG